MDANGLHFWMLAEAGHWPARAHAVWDAGCRALQLASERSLPAPADPSAAFAAANSALERIPRALDQFDAVAYWNEDARVIAVKSYLPETGVALPLNERPSDLCVGADAVLYVALPEGVLMHDLRGRWADVLVTPTDAPAGGFAPWRLTTAFPAGVWVLERDSGRLARLEGMPLPAQTPQPDDYAPGVFRPDPENCRTPTLRVLTDPAWPGDERPVALAAQADTGLALLSWVGDGNARLRCWDAGAQRLQAALGLQGARYAYALEWLDAERIVVRLPGRPDAPAFSLEFGNLADTRDALGEVYPIAADGIEAPFAHRVAGPPRYPVGDNAAEPLFALSLSNLARRGSADNFASSGSAFVAQLIDSGSTTTVWHRLYAEAAIPAHSGFTVWLAATNEARPPPWSDRQAWHPHGFGRDIAVLDAAFDAPQLPRAAWEHLPSELPGHPGLGPWSPQADTQGLYSVLIQNARQRVRTLSGRYLWLHLELFGDSRVGPQIAALRAYGSRFSYVDQYLPRVYRETLFGAAAQAAGELVDNMDSAHKAALDAAGTDGAVAGGALQARLNLAIPDLGDAAAVTVEQPGEAWLLRDASGRRTWRLTRNDKGDIGIYRPQASRADFLGRMLANFEGVLTQLEDRIAGAHLFSDPDAAPEPQLNWLAGWTGVAFDAALPAARRREWLRNAEALARWHGTRRGLLLALNIASGGGVQGGEIIVIEDFRLRRILATLLGVDLADELDPLLPGLVQSGNSIVGDTLVLGDQEQVELLAMFREQAATAAENDAVLNFYGQLASRATVLVHEAVRPQDLGLIRRIVDLESPAHVDARVVTATWPLMVGVFSLVGVDTYLGPPRMQRQVQLDRSGLGLGDYLIAPAALDPRLRGAAGSPRIPPPLADAGPDMTAGFGQSFDLDGSASHAAAGHEIAKYVWRRLPPELT
ncbi:MAG: phage tail protein [Burkholderiales bacterium]|nr:phage tail protein [Burkholderiales bacterium]